MIFATLFAFALPDPSVAKTPQSVLQKSLDQAKTKGMAIENRKSTATTDSFDLVVKDFAKITGVPQEELKPLAPKEANLSKKMPKVNPYESLNGITMHADINYSKESYDSIVYLSKFPMEGMSKEEKAVIQRVIKEKLLYITTHYNVVDSQYTMAIKDIDEQFETIKVKTKDIKANGTYDIDHLDTQKMKFNAATLMLTPTEKKFLGEYLTMSNLYITIDSTPNDKVLDLSYRVGVDLIDANISKKITKVNKANLDIKFGNLDRASYNKLIELSQTNTTMIDPNSPEMMNLVAGLLTQDLYIEIKDLSLEDLIAEGKKMGGFKANAKITLKKDPNLTQLIKINPMMALSALEVVADIELSQEMLKALSQSPKGAMLAFIPPKMENGIAKYAIEYSAKGLLVNGKPLQ